MSTPTPFPPNQNSRSLAFLFLLIALIGIMLALRNPSRSKSERLLPISTDTTYVQTTYPTSEPSRGVSLSGYILRTALILGVLAVLLYWGLRFYRGRVQAQTGGSGQIKVVGKYFFNPKQYLVAVIWNEKELLLGVTEHQFTKLAEIDFGEDESEHFSDHLEQPKKGPLNG